MSRGTLDSACCLKASGTGLSPSLAGFPKTIPLLFRIRTAVLTPTCSHAGLGSFPFARRYLGNRCFFLFLRLLRCFTSAGSLHTPMDSAHGDRGTPGRVSPFRHPRLFGYLLLTAAFRSLSRLSSAPGGQASATCLSCLTGSWRLKASLLSSSCFDLWFSCLKRYFYLFMAKIFLPLLGIVNHFTFPFVKSFRSSFGKRFRFPFLTVVFLSVWNSQGA